MPCTSNLKYPSYIKSIISEINAGNDNNLKNCLCSNKEPTDEDGCPILDEDGNVGFFPFCIPIVDDGVGDDTNYPLKLTLKQAMNLYWKVKSWTFKASDITKGCGSCTYFINFNGGQIWNGAPIMKERVCQKSYFLTTDYTTRNCCGGNPPCVTDTQTGLIVASLFDDFYNPFKCKKEGGVYYFYPVFTIQIGHYSVCAAHTQSAATDCLSYIETGVVNMPSLTTSVKIIDDNVNFKYYRSKWSGSEGPPPCSYNPTMSISQLDFNS